MVRNALGIILAIVILAFSTGVASDSKAGAIKTPLADKNVQLLGQTPRFASAEACTVRHDLGPYWLIEHWVTGAELYKSFQNPAQACTGPYPFTVEEIDIVLYFAQRCTLYVSVDVESAYLGNPSCPEPGNLLSISSEYSYIIPGQGLYLLPVPLDTPVVVNGPYFAGFYIGNVIDTLVGAAVVTDSLPALCTGYNIWDTTIGYIDLANNSYFNFPGRLILFSVGTTGGSGGVQPEPSVALLDPATNEIVAGAVRLWAVENSGSTIIDYMRFDRRSIGGWTEIGRDYDGARALRNGVDVSGTGEGYTSDWNYGSLTEGLYWLKATVYDTLGRLDVDSHQVTIDPTPPDLAYVGLNPFDSLCVPTKLEVTTSDEDLTQVQFYNKAASMNYSAAVTAINQASFGDANGNPLDGNHAAGGEFGDYYCGPVAGATMIKYWFDRGFIYCMREGTKFIPVDTVVERLAAAMQTRPNHGTYDDLFFGGMVQYLITHGNELILTPYRKPDYYQFRNLFQEQELAVVLALSGTPGIYLAAAGITGLADYQGRFGIRVCDPKTGTIIDAFMRNVTGGAQVYYGGTWHDLDMIITFKGYSHTVTRELIGSDLSPLDGWSYGWSSAAMVKDSLYFITAIATDATGRIGTIGSLVQYNCPSYVKGDYDGNGTLNIGDVLYLINYIYKGGAAPLGGAGRADANCNTIIDISDVIYAIKYVYMSGPAPCY